VRGEGKRREKVIGGPKGRNMKKEIRV